MGLLLCTKTSKVERSGNKSSEIRHPSDDFHFCRFSSPSNPFRQTFAGSWSVPHPMRFRTEGRCQNRQTIETGKRFKILDFKKMMKNEQHIFKFRNISDSGKKHSTSRSFVRLKLKKGKRIFADLTRQLPPSLPASSTRTGHFGLSQSIG